MSDENYVSKDAFDQFQKSVERELDDLKNREQTAFALIFKKLEEIKTSQTQQSGHMENLTKKLEEAVVESEFNPFFDKRMKEQGLLSKEKLELSFYKKKTDKDGNTLDVVVKDEFWEKIKRISWLGHGIWKWLIGTVGVGGVISFLIALFGG